MTAVTEPLARGEAAVELVRGREIARVLECLAEAGVAPILLKGAALAYSLYESPWLRPRSDTDLLIRREDVEPTRSALAAAGYGATNVTDGELVLGQFELARDDAFGVRHAFDFHWRISTQVAFADCLDYEDLSREATPIPALGRNARGPSPVHALLLACIHPAMHHRNEELPVWVRDVHLLASRLGPADFERFADLAVARRVAAVCAHELRRARARLGTPLPPGLLERLDAAKDEPSAVYLEAGRSWRHETAANLKGLPRWSDRLRLLKEIAFPGRDYILRAYGLDPTRASRLAPLLYVHRAVRGCWRVLTGRK